MRIVLIGAVESSLVALQTLIAVGRNVVGVCTAPASAGYSDWADLEGASRQADIPCLVEPDTRSVAVLSWAASLRPDLILCIGWSRLLGRELLSLPPLGCIGYHPAALPRNRGRHPLIWALVLGLPKTASTLFIMDEGADSGPILDQAPVTIGQEDDAATLYAKMLALLPKQLNSALTRIDRGEPPTPQDQSKATYWRKRSSRDGQIDFRMHTHTIHNLVRALTRPYPGATVSWQGANVIVWRTRPAGSVFPDIEPGAVLDVTGHEITVKTADAAIVLCDHEIQSLPRRGDYLI